MFERRFSLRSPSASRLFTVFVVLTLFVGVLAVPATATFEDSGPKILCGAQRTDTFFNLRSVHARTGATKLILEGNPSSPLAGAYSPNGKRVTYFSSAGLDNEIWVAKADGSNAHPVTDNATNDWGPSFSPDGSQIVYANTSGIVAMNADGSDSHPVIAVAPAVEPVWTPNGNWIVFSWLEGGTGWNVYRIRPDGSDLTPIADGVQHELLADVAPSGRFVIFQRSVDGDYVLFKSKLDGSEVDPLVAADGFDLTNPKISSSGLRVLYNRWDGSSQQIWSARTSDGMGRQRLVANGRNNYLVFVD